MRSADEEAAMKARELMTSNPECVTRDDDITRAAEIMRDVDVGVVPVVDSRNSMRLVGLITDRDIAIRHVAGDNASNCRVGDHMTSDRLFTASPDDDVDSVLDRMKAEQVRRIPVVEGERLVGIIAQADIATDLSKDKETGELVHRISEPGVRR
jgi:CBS domain-containing protein